MMMRHGAPYARPAITGQVDPAVLTAKELSALRLIASAAMFRCKGGYQGRGTGKVMLTVVHELARRGLIRHLQRGRHPSLDVTGTGLNTLAVADQRSLRHG